MENEIKNSIKYIDKLTEKSSGFSTPLDYFDNLQETIDLKLSEKSIPKENAFEVPESYFNNIEDYILSKVKNTNVFSFRSRVLKLVPYVAAASIALFIGLNTFILNTTNKLSLETISDNDIEYWLDSNTLNSNEVVAILQDEILEDIDFSFTEIKDESIEDYLNTIDNTSLFNELN